jgi:LemA protein
MTNPILLVPFILVAVVLLIIVGMYNGLVRLRLHCNESWSDIDTELKRRHDLIPNLVDTVKGYAAHEKAVFQRVLEARDAALASRGSPAALAKEENALTRSLHQVVALAESYPALKASSNFLALQKELANTEDRIQRARRFYNANVRDLNTRIEVVPSNILAGWFRFQPREFFEIENAAERALPAVKF